MKTSYVPMVAGMARPYKLIACLLDPRVRGEDGIHPDANLLSLRERAGVRVPQRQTFP
ncbi:hypothetical protein D9M68_1010630 [compost metagenome]